MKQLIENEFKRYFTKKSWIGLIGSMPLMVILMATQSLKANHILSIEQQFTFNTFPLYTPLHKLFTFYLFAVVILLVVTSIASEFEASEIRMVLIRGYSTRQVFFVKLLAILTALASFLIGYVACSYLIGFIMFEHQPTSQSFLSADVLTVGKLFIMTFKYYMILFLILATFAIIISFIAMMTRSIITTTVIGLLIVMISFGFYMVTQLLATYVSGIEANLLNLFALPLMQLKGIYQMIAGHSTVSAYCLMILSAYTISFTALSYYLTGRQDQFI